MAYGESAYGIHQYGEEPQGSNDSNVTPPDLMAYLPPYYQNILDMRTIQSAFVEEIGNLWHTLDDLLRQFFIQSATWSLDLWERDFGLLVDPSKPLAWRREILLAKLRGIGTVTKEMIAHVAAAFSGGEVQVIEYPSEYRFEVKFIGVKGIPPNMDGFIATLEQIKPAHLAYSLTYTYTVWNMLNTLTWNQAGTKTWNELKVYEGA